MSQSKSQLQPELLQLIEHWQSSYYKQSGELSRQDERYIKKYAQDVERDFLLDLLVMNFTGKDMMQQGEIIRVCLRTRESFVEALADESEPHMKQVANAMDDGHLEHTLSNLYKLIRVTDRLYDVLREEQLIRKENEELI